MVCLVPQGGVPGLAGWWSMPGVGGLGLMLAGCSGGELFGVVGSAAVVLESDGVPGDGPTDEVEELSVGAIASGASEGEVVVDSSVLGFGVLAAAEVVGVVGGGVGGWRMFSDRLKPRALSAGLVMVDSRMVRAGPGVGLGSVYSTEQRWVPSVLSRKMTLLRLSASRRLVPLPSMTWRPRPPR